MSDGQNATGPGDLLVLFDMRIDLEMNLKDCKQSLLHLPNDAGVMDPRSGLILRGGSSFSSFDCQLVCNEIPYDVSERNVWMFTNEFGVIGHMRLDPPRGNCEVLVPDECAQVTPQFIFLGGDALDTSMNCVVFLNETSHILKPRISDINLLSKKVV